MAVEEMKGNRPEVERPGPEQYAPRRQRESNVVRAPTKSVEAGINAFKAEIHELVREGVARAPQNSDETNAPGHSLTDNIDALIGRAIAEPLEGIDQLMVELQKLRNMLREEGDRVGREVAGYASLNHSVKTMMISISESLRQFRR